MGGVHVYYFSVYVSFSAFHLGLLRFYKTKTTSSQAEAKNDDQRKSKAIADKVKAKVHTSNQSQKRLSKPIEQYDFNKNSRPQELTERAQPLPGVCVPFSGSLVKRIGWDNYAQKYSPTILITTPGSMVNTNFVTRVHVWECQDLSSREFFVRMIKRSWKVATLKDWYNRILHSITELYEIYLTSPLWIPSHEDLPQPE